MASSLPREASVNPSRREAVGVGRDPSLRRASVRAVIMVAMVGGVIARDPWRQDEMNMEH